MMKKILLSCSAGMSTSLLVSKMKEVAEEQSLSVQIDAVSSDNAFSMLNSYDVLLIGPQMRFMKRRFEKHVKEQNISIPIDVIDTVAYGRIDGAGVLKQALNLIE
ncbi:PTS sugar transporter subunit IIB [Staphylococcus gallinarum]|uniref:PTS sugar transporter subunit IIB n=2 Tax=Staphylococcus gallinarum TaxID=1293 RepID=A0A380FBU3_STAGA|nr:PTS sugar transporter subunit IIB [Staphylococcus gallinarum]SUM31672.1 phosphotransferase system cellobiose-specific component IIB [Staphylococcus gallinarum]